MVSYTYIPYTLNYLSELQSFLTFIKDLYISVEEGMNVNNSIYANECRTVIRTETKVIAKDT